MVTPAPLTGFDDATLGTLQFWTDFADDYTTDVSGRFTAVADRGALGYNWAGGTSSNEPAKVTNDGIVGASCDLHGTQAQFFSAATVSASKFLHAPGCNIYALAIGQDNPDASNSYIISTQASSSQSGLRLVYRDGNARFDMYMGNGTDAVFTTSSSELVFPADGSRWLLGAHIDATGLQWSKNGVYIGSNIAPAAAYGTGDPANATTYLLNYTTPDAGNSFKGPLELLLAYEFGTAKHTEEQAAQLKSLVNSVYGLSL